MIEQTPLVSVIIPVFNGQKYLDECIMSILNQTYSNLEIIAVDDGSTDESIDILRKYGDKIKIIQKKNGGTSSALNLGIKEMSGEWFKWLGQDDVLYPNAIEELINVVKGIKEMNQWIIVSDYDIIDSEGRIIYQFKEPDFNQLTKFEFNVCLLDHFIGNANSSLIHKSSFDLFGGFSEENNIIPDWELWLRFCLQYNVNLYFIRKPLIKYRTHVDSISQKTSEKDRIKLVNKMRESILKRLNSDDREKYIKALQDFQTKKPIIFKARRKIRDLLFQILPKSVSHKISKTYLNKLKSN